MKAFLALLLLCSLCPCSPAPWFEQVLKGIDTGLPFLENILNSAGVETGGQITKYGGHVTTIIKQVAGTGKEDVKVCVFICHCQ